MSDKESNAAGRGDLRTYWSMVAVMFQGAFSDNVFRFIVNLQLLNLALATAPTPQEATAMGAKFSTYVGLSFALPWILAATFAGWLSDRFAKAHVTQWTKLMEIGVMALGTLVFAIGQPLLGVFVLFLMNLQSALFGPSKYGILPEIMPEGRVAWANGIMQGLTFVAIICGTVVGPWMSAQFSSNLWVAGLLLTACAGIGYVASLGMQAVPPAAEAGRMRINPVHLLRLYGGEIWRHTGLRWATFGMVVFWTVALMLQLAAIQILKTVLRMGDEASGIGLIPLVVGNGVGCIIVAMVCRRRIELGLVPIGAFLMFVTCMATWWLTPLSIDGAPADAAGAVRWMIPVAFGLVGLCCGSFIVPLQSYIVQTTHPSVRGGVWATGNLLTATGWIVASVMQGKVIAWTGNPAAVFLVGGVVMLLAGVIVCWRFPMVPLRFLALIAFGMLYRVRAGGTENVPREGGALLVANHQSFLDALLIGAAIERPVRFLIHHKMYRHPLISPIAKAGNAIPIDPHGAPRQLVAALREAAAEIQRGGLVCIFPEGQLTRTGQVLPFRRGVERIMRGQSAPIIPVALDGAIETTWGRPRGEARALRPRLLRRPLTILFGAPRPADTPVAVLRRDVVDLMAEAFAMRAEDHRPLHRLAWDLLGARGGWRQCVDHATPGGLTNRRLRAAVIVLGRMLKPRWQDQTHVGLLLPPSIGTAALNIAALMAGRVPVNLNYTMTTELIGTVCSDAGIRLIITSREFLAKARLRVPDGFEVVYTEDMRRDVTPAMRITALLESMLLPVATIERRLGRTRPAGLHDLATLIYSSGSTGVPKGVMLSHWNILSNVIALRQVVHIKPNDRLLGVLPFFHSFGFTAGLWLPLTSGLGVTFHPNPLDARAIGHIVERDQVTIMFGTPTFLSTYTRRIDPMLFGSLRYVVSGAEKLRPQVAAAFKERFGLDIHEGFGCTETSPAVALNVPDYREAGIYQRAARPGSVGRPLPGVAVRVVAIDTGEPLGFGVPGLLQVRGANVMQGYYNKPEKTAEVLRDGWYTTGDMATVDEEGFVTITDRLARFSKIGGEMVPHHRIEQALHELMGRTDIVLAVTCVPDEKKGERLVVVHTLPEDEMRRGHELLMASGLPALWLPRWSDYVRVAALPLLGSGKLDLQRLKQIAREAQAAAGG
jgi:acyl-[acyl-carrier-protein]-phospholipid O-acyltransferase/long-chain-fatty-acid--[acyl-carrier-protein] ligase